MTSLEYLDSKSFLTRLTIAFIICIFCFSTFAAYLQNNEHMQEQLKIYKQRQAEWERDVEEQNEKKIKIKKRKEWLTYSKFISLDCLLLSTLFQIIWLFDEFYIRRYSLSDFYI